MQKDLQILSNTQYRGLPYISQSLVKAFMSRGPSALIEDSKISNTYMGFGSMIDCYLLEPEKFYDSYFVADIPNITDNMREAMDEAYNFISMNFPKEEREFSARKSEILSITSKYYSSIKDPEKRWNNFQLGKDYYDTLQLSSGRIIVPSSDFALIKDAETTLKGSPFFKYIDNSNPRYENLFQLQLVGKFLDTIFKIKIDILHIDHEEKKIYIIDLKTGHVRNDLFRIPFHEFKLYIQGTIYRNVFREVMKLDTGLTEYTLEEFGFLFYSTDTKLFSYHIYQEDWDKYIIEGMNTKYINIRGLTEILKDIKWHNENQEFKLSKQLLEQGLVEIIPLPS